MIVNRKDLSAILGVTPPTIDARIAKGLPVLSRGTSGQAAQFDTAEVINWMVEQAKQTADASPAEKDGMRELQRRKLLAETEQAELELARKKGEVVPVEEALSAISDAVTILRQRMLTLPRRVAPLILGETDEDVTKSLIEREVLDVLEELSRNALEADDLLGDSEEEDLPPD